MKIQLYILTILGIPLLSIGQSQISNFEIDSNGKITIVIPFKGNKVEYNVQRQQNSEWSNIYSSSVSVIFESENQTLKDSIFVPLNIGINRFKLTVSSLSKEIEIKSEKLINNIPECKVYNGDIYLKNMNTNFCIRDSKGNLIKCDSGIIRTSKFKSGKYLINIDNHIFEYEK